MFTSLIPNFSTALIYEEFNRIKYINTNEILYESNIIINYKDLRKLIKQRLKQVDLLKEMNYSGIIKLYKIDDNKYLNIRIQLRDLMSIVKSINKKQYDIDNDVEYSNLGKLSDRCFLKIDYYFKNSYENKEQAIFEFKNIINYAKFNLPNKIICLYTQYYRECYIMKCIKYYYDIINTTGKIFDSYKINKIEKINEIKLLRNIIYINIEKSLLLNNLLLKITENENYKNKLIIINVSLCHDFGYDLKNDILFNTFYNQYQNIITFIKYSNNIGEPNEKKIIKYLLRD